MRESSGIVASRSNPGLFWTHNDSGDGPNLYALDGQGKSRGVWRATGAKSRDWEAIAAGPGPEGGRSYLYIGDIGDNDYERDVVVVYRVPEPSVTTADTASTKANPRPTEAAEPISLKYPDGPHDAETLMVHPQSGDIYIVAKSLDPSAGIYKLAAPASTSEVNELVRIGDVRAPGAAFPGYFTGGDISPDGTRVVLCDYVNAYELTVTTGTFDEVWKQAPLVVDLGERQQGEAVCYGADGQTIVATNEGRHAAIVEVRRKPSE